MQFFRNNKAFGLIETAIVLLVIACLYGGVKVGYSLLHKSKLISVSAEIDNCITAYDEFLSIYGKLPGDIDSDFLHLNADQESSTKESFGDGNGQITGPVFQENSDASLVFFHLSLARLINNSEKAISTKMGGYISIQYLENFSSIESGHYLVLGEKDSSNNLKSFISFFDAQKIKQYLQSQRQVWFLVDSKKYLLNDKAENKSIKNKKGVIAISLE